MAWCEKNDHRTCIGFSLLANTFLAFVLEFNYLRQTAFPLIFTFCIYILHDNKGILILCIIEIVRVQIKQHIFGYRAAHCCTWDPKFLDETWNFWTGLDFPGLTPSLIQRSIFIHNPVEEGSFSISHLSQHIYK